MVPMKSPRRPCGDHSKRDATQEGPDRLGSAHGPCVVYAGKTPPERGKKSHGSFCALLDRLCDRRRGCLRHGRGALRFARFGGAGRLGIWRSVHKVRCCFFGRGFEARFGSSSAVFRRAGRNAVGSRLFTFCWLLTASVAGHAAMNEHYIVGCGLGLRYVEFGVGCRAKVNCGGKPDTAGRDAPFAQFRGCRANFFCRAKASGCAG